MVQTAHKASGIVVDFFAGSASSDQYDIGLDARDLPFDIVVTAKCKNLVIQETNQICECAALRVHLFQGQWRFQLSPFEQNPN